MHQGAMANPNNKRTPHPEDNSYHYSSVEISNNDISLCYHFKLWNMSSTDLCILVKESSRILPQLKEGATYNMKYYGCNSLSPTESRKTAVRHVIKDDGRFKGHYLVHLEILDQ